MKRLIVAINILVVILGLATPSVHAADITCADGTTASSTSDCVPLNPFSGVCQDGSSSSVCQADGTKNPISGKDGALSKAINIFSYLIGAASIIMILLGSIKYITSGGNSNGVSSAKNTITYALIGVAVFLLSRAIITFVINRL